MKMTEGRAIVLVFVAGIVAIFASCSVLISLGAEGGALFLMAMAICVVVIQAFDAIMQHYSKERRKRER